MTAADETPRTLVIDLIPGAWALGDQLVQTSTWTGAQCTDWLDAHTPYNGRQWASFTVASLRRAVAAVIANRHAGRDVQSIVRETWR